MLKSAFLTGGLWLSAATLAFSADAIGFRETDLDKEGSRPLHVAVWYPVHDQSGPAVTVGENAVFYGIDAIRDAAPSSEARPLVVLSHGYGGSWRNLNWLASALVEQGYIVAAPDHPGTTTFNKDAAQAATLWERPRDLSRVIDALIADPHLAGRIDVKRIAAIGHSLGGWTISALAGGRFDTQQFEMDCRTHTSPRACNLAAELGLGDARLEIPSGVSSGLHRGRVRSLENSLEANHADNSRSNSGADHYPRRSWRNFCVVGIKQIDMARDSSIAGK